MRKELEGIENTLYQNTMIPLITLNGTELGQNLSLENAFTAAHAYYKSVLQGSTIVSQHIGEIRFTGKGWQKLKNGLKVDFERTLLIPAITDVLQKGEYLGQAQSDEIRTDAITAFHYFSAPVMLEQQYFEVGVTIAEDNRGRLFYNMNQNPHRLQIKRLQRNQGKALGLEPTRFLHRDNPRKI